MTIVKRRHHKHFDFFSIEMSKIIVFKLITFDLYDNFKFIQFKNDLNKFHFSDFFKFDQFDNHDFLQNVMLRLIKNKKMKNLNIEKNKFRESNIDYFDSHKFESYDSDDYVIVTNKIYYRNV